MKITIFFLVEILISGYQWLLVGENFCVLGKLFFVWNMSVIEIRGLQQVARHQAFSPNPSTNHSGDELFFCRAFRQCKETDIRWWNDGTCLWFFSSRLKTGVGVISKMKIECQTWCFFSMATSIELLLMAEILHRLRSIKACKWQWDKPPINWLAGFLPAVSQV